MKQTFLRDSRYFIPEINKLVAVIFTLFFLLFAANAYSFPEQGSLNFSLRLFMDSGFLVNMADYYPPYLWLAFHFGALYYISHIIYEDFQANAIYFLVRLGKKESYWLPKVAMAWVLSFSIVLAMLIPIILVMMIFDRNTFISDLPLLLRQYLSLGSTLSLFSTLIMLLFLSFPYIVAYVLTCISIILPTLLNYRFILGAQSLVGKQDFLSNKGLSLPSATLSVVLYGLLLVLANIFFFSKKEVY